MGELGAVLGLLGAGACLAERLPGPSRSWGPAAVVVAVMALMACGAGGTVLAAGACAVAGAGVWTALAGPPRRRAPAAVDLAVMALLTAQAARAPARPSGMRMGGGPATCDLRLFAFLTACWLLARAAVALTALVGSEPRCAPGRAGAGASAAVRVDGRTVLRELGGAAMVGGMAAMLA